MCLTSNVHGYEIISLRTDHIRTVVLVVRFANLALETSLDLSAHANSVANLAGGDLVASFDHLADNFMTNANW